MHTLCNLLFYLVHIIKLLQMLFLQKQHFVILSYILSYPSEWQQIPLFCYIMLSLICFYCWAFRFQFLLLL